MSQQDRAFILQQAMDVTTKDRNTDYDEPERNFQRISDLWSTYLDGYPIAPYDVAVMCALIKVARIMTSPGKSDHWVDLAGYAACGWDAHEASKP